MNPIFEWGIHIISWLQNGAPWFILPAQLLSMLGNEEFYLFVLPSLYWCVDFRLGLRVAVILTVSDSFEILFKLLFHQTRPFWITDRVHAFSAEGSYGLPSGHAQNATAVWGAISAWCNGWFRWLFAALIFLIGCSRIALAVHFPTDVLGGWLIGALILLIFLKYEALISAWFNHFSLAMKIVLAFDGSMALLGISMAGLIFVPGVDPLNWEINAARALSLVPGQLAVHAHRTGGMFAVSGTFFGLVSGATLMLHRGGFDACGAWWKRILRYVIGMIGAIILWWGLRVVLPRDEFLVSQVMRYLRYALSSFWVTYAAPCIFIQLGLQNMHLKANHT